MNSNDTDISSDISQVSIPRYIRLILLLIFDILSFTCAIFVLFQLLSNQLLRKSLHNHVVIALLFNTLPTFVIDIPFYIIYLHFGYVWPSSPGFCRFWLFVDVGIFNTILILMGYAAIERHILVFHDRWMLNKRRRILLHYVPLMAVIVYSLTFYTYAILFPPCTNTIDYSAPWCSHPCYYDNPTLSMFDNIANLILPSLLVSILSVALLLRFVYQRRRFMLNNSWRKYRKMIIQLMSISSILIIFQLPTSILLLAHVCGLSADVGAVFAQYAYFFTYFIAFLLPFVCLGSSPEIAKKLIKLRLFHLRRAWPRWATQIQPAA